MSFYKILSAALIAATTASGAAAAAAPIGFAQVTGQGGVVLRSGSLLSMKPGMALYARDRIVTRARGGAKLQMRGCATTIGPLSTFSVGNGCGGTVSSIQYAQAQTTLPAGGGAAGAGTTAGASAGAAAGTGAGAAAAGATGAGIGAAGAVAGAVGLGAGGSLLGVVALVAAAAGTVAAVSNASEPLSP